MSKNTRYITASAMIAALYVVLCFIFRPISFSVFQIRIAEALCVLPYFTSAAIPGVSIGCLLANILCGADILDTVFGTVATLLGALAAYALRKRKFLVPVPTVLTNTIIIPIVLRFAYGEAQPLLLLILGVGVGELISCGILGTILLLTLDKYRSTLFRS